MWLGENEYHDSRNEGVVRISESKEVTVNLDES